MPSSMGQGESWAVWAGPCGLLAGWAGCPSPEPGACRAPRLAAGCVPKGRQALARREERASPGDESFAKRVRLQEAVGYFVRVLKGWAIGRRGGAVRELTGQRCSSTLPVCRIFQFGHSVMGWFRLTKAPRILLSPFLLRKRKKFRL